MGTLPWYVNPIIAQYVSKDPKGDRDLLLRGQKLEKLSGPENRKLCLRNLFIDEEDIKIGKIVEQYFLAVQSRWPRAWKHKGTGIMLNRTNGFRALMRIFGRIYNYLGEPGDFISEKEFRVMLDRVNADWTYFKVENFRPGSSGESDLRKFLEKEIFD